MRRCRWRLWRSLRGVGWMRWRGGSRRFLRGSGGGRGGRGKGRGGGFVMWGWGLWGRGGGWGRRGGRRGGGDGGVVVVGGWGCLCDWVGEWMRLWGGLKWRLFLSGRWVVHTFWDSLYYTLLSCPSINFRCCGPALTHPSIPSTRTRLCSQWSWQGDISCKVALQLV